MGSKTEISWTDATWNPVRGCSMAKGSEAGGCLNCYAARMASRNLPELKSPTTGKPFARILQSGPRWTGDVELIEKALGLPLKWRTPKRVFVNSMSDLFHEALPFEEIDRIFSVMAGCHRHAFQVLTKRPERMLAYMKRFKPDGRGWVTPEGQEAELTHCPLDASRWPPPNVWLGVSVEDQATADARIPLLLQTPAAKRFVSYEPALGPVDFTKIEFRHATWYNALEDHDGFGMLGAAHQKLDWIIVGGESGPGARPFDIDWARNTIEQCAAAGVACFVKQLGAKPILNTLSDPNLEGWHDIASFRMSVSDAKSGQMRIILKDRKGGDWTEWPEDLRVRQFPEVRA